jgi:hypothetical protein
MVGQSLFEPIIIPTGTVMSVSFVILRRQQVAAVQESGGFYHMVEPNTANVRYERR